MLPKVTKLEIIFLVMIYTHYMAGMYTYVQNISKCIYISICSICSSFSLRIGVDQNGEGGGTIGAISSSPK